MFGQEEDDDSDFEFPTGKPASLASLFGSSKKSGKNETGNTSVLKYQAPKQPSNRTQAAISQDEPVQMAKNIEKKEQDEAEFEPMCNVRPGVKMATAVVAYKYENNAFKPVGKLGLAIIGNKDSNFYQMLMYKGKQQPVAVANITMGLIFKVQPGNYANFSDDKANNWTICFDSHDLLVNFAKQVLLCKAVFKLENEIYCDVSQGDGKAVEEGDSVEIKMSGWSVENQSIGPMFESTSGKERGLRFKVGAKKVNSGLESGVVGMKKGGRRFIIVPSSMPSGSNLSQAPKNSMLAFDAEVTRTKSTEQHIQEPQHQNTVYEKSEKHDVIQRIAKYGQPMVRPTMPDNERSPDLADLEDGGNYPGTSHLLSEQFGSTHSLHRSETPMSVYSTTSASNERRQSDLHERRRSDSNERRQSDAASAMHIQSHRGNHNWSQSGGNYTAPDWNNLMSETRLQNTEMRMSMQRVSDKVDQLLSRNVPIRMAEQEITLGDVKHELGCIKEQNKQIKDCLIQKQVGQPAVIGDHEKKSGQDLIVLQEENETKQAKLDRQAKKLEELEEKLREKENKLFSMSQNYEQNIAALKEQLDEAGNSTTAVKEMAKTEIRSELKKVMSSTAKVLHAQFVPDESYTGDTVGEVITDTLRQIAVKLLQKYDSESVGKSLPPVATVIPITPCTDRQEHSSEDEEWQEDDQ